MSKYHIYNSKLGCGIFLCLNSATKHQNVFYVTVLCLVRLLIMNVLCYSPWMRFRTEFRLMFLPFLEECIEYRYLFHSQHTCDNFSTTGLLNAFGVILSERSVHKFAKWETKSVQNINHKPVLYMYENKMLRNIFTYSTIWLILVWFGLVWTWFIVI